MGDFKLSTYQENIINYVKNERGNLLVDAKAGSGKTSTLILISDYLKETGKSCLFLAFNKSIVEELKTKLNNPLCEVKTIHSTGLTFIRSYLYRLHKQNYNLEINTSKVRELVKFYFDRDCKQNVLDNNLEDLGEDATKDLINKLIGELVKLVDFCRFFMVNYHEPNQVINTMYKCCFELKKYKSIGIENFTEVIENTIDTIKDRFEHPDIDPISNKPTYIIDYTDMVYFPLYYNMNTPYSLKGNLQYVLVDEAQDLSILQQLFVKKLNNGLTRYIFVGDAKQSIYGFAGADTQSIENIKKNFTLQELPLNICYRCPEKVVKVAQYHVPTIEWNKQRDDEGIVKILNYEDFEKNLKPNDIIIGRSNYRLLKLYKEFCLDKQMQIKFKNKGLVDTIIRDITSAILDYISKYNKFENIDVELYEDLKTNKIPISKNKRNAQHNEYVKKKALELIQRNKKSGKKISKQNYSVDYLKVCMEEFKEKGSYRFEDEDSPLLQYYDTIEVFIDKFKNDRNAFTVKSFIKYLETFLTGNDHKDVPILSSVHMMKGGEADRVFIVDYSLFPYEASFKTEDENQQERNLEYVAVTRAKKELYLVLVNENEKTESDFKSKEEYDSWLLRVTNANNMCQDKIVSLLNGKFFDKEKYVKPEFDDEDEEEFDDEIFDEVLRSIK